MRIFSFGKLDNKWIGLDNFCFNTKSFGGIKQDEGVGVVDINLHRANYTKIGKIRLYENCSWNVCPAFAG